MAKNSFKSLNKHQNQSEMRGMLDLTDWELEKSKEQLYLTY